MTIQPTASKSVLLLQCQRPFEAGIETHDEPGSEALYGTALHEELYALYLGDAREYSAHALDTWRVVQEWLLNNQLDAKLRIVGAERHMALRLTKIGRGVVKYEGRETGFDPESHTYELASYEIGGTYDLLCEGPDGIRVVLDYKTGRDSDFRNPARNAQLLTLALLTDATHVGIIHCPRDEPAMVYVDPVSRATLRAHAGALRDALGRIGEGYLRPGDGRQCKYCPAKHDCPANNSEVILSASSLVRTVTQGPLAAPEDGGAFHMMLTEFGRLEKIARDKLRADVEAGIIYERPDGKVLTMQYGEEERMSKADIIAAYGKAEGERVLERLRKDGALLKKPTAKLVAR